MTLLKKSKTAIPTALAITLISLAIMGFTYAHWSETLWLNGTVTTGTLCAEFVDVSNKDLGLDWNCDNGINKYWQIDKDIGNTTVYIVEDGECPNTIEVIMDKVYPCYYENIEMHVHNCGTIPWKIIRVNFTTPYEQKSITGAGYLTLDMSGDGKPDVEIKWGNSFGMQVDPCTEIELSFKIHVLQDAPEDTTMTFTITIIMINWNE
jgi:hypothetical protein